MIKREKRLETKGNNYHFRVAKAKEMEYYDFNKNSLQEQSCDYYRNLPDEKIEEKREYARNRHKNSFDEKKENIWEVAIKQEN